MIKNIYVKIAGGVLFIVCLLAWRQSIISMQPTTATTTTTTTTAAPATEIDINALASLPLDMQREILKHKPAHPALVQYMIKKLCSDIMLKHIFHHNASVTSVAFSPDGKYALTGSWDDSAKLWDVSSGNLVHTLQHNDMVESAVFSPDGKYALTGSFDKTAKLWDVSSGSLVQTLQHNGSLTSVAFSPDGKYALTGSGDNTAKIWDVKSGRLVHTLQHNGLVWSVAFSPDGKYALTGSSDNTAKIWNVSLGNPVHTLLHDGWVRSVAFSPDGKYILTGARNFARKWDVSSGAVVNKWRQNVDVYSVAFSADGNHMLAGSAVAFGPHSKYAIKADSIDYGTAIIWDISAGILVGVLQHNGNVTSVAFSPDGKYVLTGSEDKTARLWDLSCILNLTARLQFVTLAQYELLQMFGRLLEQFKKPNEAILKGVYATQAQMEAFDALPDDIKNVLRFMIKPQPLTMEEEQEQARQARLKRFEKKD